MQHQSTRAFQRSTRAVQRHAFQYNQGTNFHDLIKVSILIALLCVCVFIVFFNVRVFLIVSFKYTQKSHKNRTKITLIL